MDLKATMIIHLKCVILGIKLHAFHYLLYAILKCRAIILTDVFLNNHRRYLEIILAISDFNVWHLFTLWKRTTIMLLLGNSIWFKYRVYYFFFILVHVLMTNCYFDIIYLRV